MGKRFILVVFVKGSGFRGVVEVKSKTFKGLEVWKSKKEAHQEVAKIALDFMKANPEEAESSEDTKSGSSKSVSSTKIVRKVKML